MFTKSDGWWKDNSYVAILAYFLVDYKGYSGKDLMRLIEKPYDFSNELNEMLYSGEHPELEDMYGHMKKGGLQPNDIAKGIDEIR